MMLLNKNAKEAAAAAAASTPPDPSGQDMSQSFAALLTAPDDEIQKKEASKKSQKIGITFLKSHQKELSKMPQLLQSKIKKAILRKPRFHNGAYEKRACIDGIMLYSCSSDPDECERKFIADIALRFLEDQHQRQGMTAKKLPTNFHDFATYYFENVKKRLTVQQTYEGDLNRYKNHIYPKLKNYPLKHVTPEVCQEIIDSLTAAGKGKTSDEVFSLLNGIFKYAVARGIIRLNPMETVVHFPHECEHGRALTKAEEKRLFDETQGTEYQTMFAIALYTGMRPYEYDTASLHGNFIVAQNCKRKNAKQGKIEWKRIPICPMLAPFLEGIDHIDMYGAETMRYKFKRLFPDHTLKDLRTTFYTRCETYHVSDKARDRFVGHSSGKLHDSYSDLPDEYLIEEAQKLKYPLDITVTPIMPPKKDRFGLAKKVGKRQKPRFQPK